MADGSSVHELFTDSGGRARVFTAPCGELAVYSRGAPDHVGQNEDAAGVFVDQDGNGVLVVADGVGGGAQGAEASRLAVEAVGNSVAASETDPNSLRSVVLDGIERANTLVQELRSGAACTINVVQVVGGSARPFHVGDSMTLHVGQRGKLKHQSIAHGPTGYAVESGMLDEREAMNHEERHVVSNVLGGPEMRIDVGPVLGVARHDTILLATDGLFDNLFQTEIIELIRKGPLAKSAERLVELCSRRMTAPEPGEPSKPDDLTFILFRPAR